MFVSMNTYRFPRSILYEPYQNSIEVPIADLLGPHAEQNMANCAALLPVSITLWRKLIS